MGAVLVAEVLGCEPAFEEGSGFWSVFWLGFRCFCIYRFLLHCSGCPSLGLEQMLLEVVKPIADLVVQQITATGFFVLRVPVNDP